MCVKRGCIQTQGKRQPGWQEMEPRSVGINCWARITEVCALVLPPWPWPPPMSTLLNLPPSQEVREPFGWGSTRVGYSSQTAGLPLSWGSLFAPLAGPTPQALTWAKAGLRPPLRRPQHPALTSSPKRSSIQNTAGGCRAGPPQPRWVQRHMQIKLSLHFIYIRTHTHTAHPHS